MMSWGIMAAVVATLLILGVVTLNWFVLIRDIRAHTKDTMKDE